MHVCVNMFTYMREYIYIYIYYIYIHMLYPNFLIKPPSSIALHGRPFH